MILQENDSELADDLVLKVLDLLEQRWINEDQLNTLTTGFCAAEDRLTFLRELLLFIRTLPEPLFSDQEQRQHWLSLCQTLLDEAIEREEDDLAED